MKRYDAYKDSGVKWIGKIPSHWEVKKLRTCFQERREKVSDKDYAPLSVSKLGITPQLDTAVKTDNGDNRKKVAKGDFVVNSRSDRKGSCGFSDYDGSVSLINIVLTPRKINKLFYHYLFRSNNYIEEFYSQGRGIVADLWTTRYSEMKNINIPVPPLPEQQAIVDYLKDKTFKIEQYVSARERERELLDSLKQSEIANIVTKGLNPNVKMKDSGITWIGKIPEHWEVKKIRSCFKERREKVSDKDFAALSVSKLGVTPQLETAVKTDNGDNRKKVCKGDFVVNSRSDRKGSCGYSEYDGSVSLINIVLTPRNVDVRFYHYLFRSNNYIEEFYRQGRGIVADLWTTRYSEMKSIYIPVPPLSEQQAIVAYIDEKLQKIDQYMADLQREIDYLKEFKQRLISDAVTGQLCVTKQ